MGPIGNESEEKQAPREQRRNAAGLNLPHRLDGRPNNYMIPRLRTKDKGEMFRQRVLISLMPYAASVS